jgi:putative transposase
MALRAQILLLADEGLNHRAIARELGISRDMARLWRNRWLELSQKDLPMVERLADAPRPGEPASFSLEQILQLFAIACEKPEAYGRPISHWTPRELAQGIGNSRHCRIDITASCEAIDERSRPQAAPVAILA